MELFISWSGERSRGLAQALRNWLPKVINAVQPWLSSADIDKGARWSADVASKLESAKVGIICVTPANLHSDWILFEAGALSKTLQGTFVCPLLLDLNPSDISGPLAQFQLTRATKEDIKRLVDTINEALGEHALEATHLDESFEVWWPKLEDRIRGLPRDTTEEHPTREDRHILEEILALVRQNSRETAIAAADVIRDTSEVVPDFLSELSEAQLREEVKAAAAKLSYEVRGLRVLKSPVVQLIKVTLNSWSAKFPLMMPIEVFRERIERLIRERISNPLLDSPSSDSPS